MKKILSITAIAFMLASCNGTWLMYDTNQVPEIYFEEALQTHSSSFALIPEDTVVVYNSVFVMGMPADHDRTFTIEYIPAADTATFTTGNVSYPVKTARPGIDFSIEDLYIPAGAVQSTMKINIYRTAEMSEGCYMRIGFRLTENDNFKPCATDSSSTQRIMTPEYYYYVTDGEPSCPTWWRNGNSTPGWNFNWGKFYPDKYRRLLEYYHTTKETCPPFYNYCVEHYGYNLDAEPSSENNKMNTFWRQAYMAAWAKYVAMPLYEYYLKYYSEHPDDPNYEMMGDSNVNIKLQIGWGNPMSGTYGFMN